MSGDPASVSAHPSQRGPGGRRRVWTWVGGVVAVLFVAAAAFGAGRVVALDAPAGDAQSEAPVTVTVSEEEVGRTFQLNTTVTQERVPLAANLLAGVVTWVGASGEFGQGQTLYEVAGVPVRAVAGSTPFYRALAPDMAGQDVRQLNQVLADLGYLAGVDDQFDTWTENALKDWQDDLGMEETGSVALGELVAVPALPATLFLDPQVARPGGVLAGDEDIVSQTAGSPSFFLEVSESQAQQIPSTATVEVINGENTWDAVIADSKRDEAQNVTDLVLTAPDGSAVCGDECASLPASEKLYLPSRVQVVAPESGPAVPVAALSTQPDGSVTLAVVSAAGAVEQRPVTVRAAQDGIAIVDGVQVGEVVEVFGGSTPARSLDGGNTGDEGGPATQTSGSTTPGRPGGGDASVFESGS